MAPRRREVNACIAGGPAHVRFLKARWARSASANTDIQAVLHLAPNDEAWTLFVRDVIQFPPGMLPAVQYAVGDSDIAIGISLGWRTWAAICTRTSEAANKGDSYGYSDSDEGF